MRALQAEVVVRFASRVIKTGRFLFQWNSADHVPYRDSHMPMPGVANMPWDWFHINAVHLDTDGNLLIRARGPGRRGHGQRADHAQR
jgi:hypothetical protein